MACCIEITGETTELVVDSIKKAISTEDYVDSRQIRLFNVDLARLNEEQVTMMEELLNSRHWDRAVICLCRGRLSEVAARGILKTKRLELYGNHTTLNLLDFYAKQSSSPSSTLSSMIENMKLRTRFDRTSIIPLSQIISTDTTLQALNLTCEFLDRESMISMADGLGKNQNLKNLTMYSCELFDESSTEILVRSLIHHPTLSTLALQDNNHLAMSAVTELISQTRGLKSLTLYRPPLEINQVQVPQINIESLSIALKKNKSLKSIDLSNNGLNDGSAIWDTPPICVINKM